MANITTSTQTAKIKILGYTLSGTIIEIEYMIGDEDYRECVLNESEINDLIPITNRIVDVPESFNSFTGDTTWGTRVIPLEDYLDHYADDVVEAWKEKEESNVLPN